MFQLSILWSIIWITLLDNLTDDDDRANWTGDRGPDWSRPGVFKSHRGNWLHQKQRVDRCPITDFPFFVAITRTIFNPSSPTAAGKNSYHGRSLHHIATSAPNPYEQAISIIGRTLSAFDEDNLIPCFGFGDGNNLHSLFVFIDEEQFNPLWLFIKISSWIQHPPTTTTCSAST